MTENTEQKQPVSQLQPASASASPIPILAYQLPRNPCIFSGEDQQDATTWLKDFNRIAAYNRWDEQMCLANVVFFLAGTARQWFDNNEDNLTTWTVFREALQSTFCRSDDIKRQAQRLLTTRAQRADESAESYIQDVLRLCRKANPGMEESDKIAHLMKGIAEDLYHVLLVQEFDSSEALIKRCREIESSRRRRVNRSRFQRLPNVSTLSYDSGADLRSMIRSIVQEELQKILPEAQCCSDESEAQAGVASMIRDEVMEALAPITTSRRRNTLAQTRRPAPARPQPRREAAQRNTTRRRTDVWRTADNVPLCYHCGRPGHVLRYCRDRRQVFANAGASRRPRDQRDFDLESLQSSDDTYTQTTPTNYRNGSPYPRRIIRRQSQSPLRRTSSRSPRRSDEEN